MTLKQALAIIPETKIIISPRKSSAEYLPSIVIDYLATTSDFSAAMEALKALDKTTAQKNRVRWIHYNTAEKCIEIDIDIQ